MTYIRIQAKIDQIKILAAKSKIYDLSKNLNFIKNMPRDDLPPY